MVDLATFKLAPGKAVLILTNLQNEYCAPGGLKYSPENAECIPAIKALVESARRSGVPIVYIQSIRTQKEAAVTVWDHERILHENSWNAQIVDELFPGEVNEYVVRSNSHDPFFNTELDNVLRQIVPNPTEHYAIVTGLPSNIDLWHAVDGFHLRDYWTVLPVDCAAGDAEVHRETLERWDTFGHWNVFASRSDLITFDPSISTSGRVTDHDRPGRILNR